MIENLVYEACPLLVVLLYTQNFDLTDLSYSLSVLHAVKSFFHIPNDGETEF